MSEARCLLNDAEMEILEACLLGGVSVSKIASILKTETSQIEAAIRLVERKWHNLCPDSYKEIVGVPKTLAHLDYVIHQIIGEHDKQQSEHLNSLGKLLVAKLNILIQAGQTKDGS